MVVRISGALHLINIEARERAGPQMGVIDTSQEDGPVLRPLRESHSDLGREGVVQISPVKIEVGRACARGHERGTL
jgi:hypothetical protein